MKIVFSLYLFLLLFFGCNSSQKKSDQGDFLDFNSMPETVENLENKFQVETPKEIIKEIPKEIKTSQQVKQKKVDKKKKVLPIISQNPLTRPVQNTKNVVTTNILPEDYPKEFEDYDKSSQELWKKFKPLYFPGEKIQMELRYFGITCASILISSMPIEKVHNEMTYHYHGRMISAPFYKYLYTLDDTIQTYVAVDGFHPVKYSIMQRESVQKVDDLQFFNRKSRQTQVWYEKTKRGNLTKYEKTVYTPYFIQDSYSALFFVRGLPLLEGDIYEFPVVTRGKLWIIKVRVGEREIVKVNDKPMDAIKVYAQTHFPGVLEKQGDILFWYSNDEYKKLLKFSAKVKLGTLEGELVHYEK